METVPHNNELARMLKMNASLSMTVLWSRVQNLNLSKNITVFKNYHHYYINHHHVGQFVRA
jgi:hypothetical protein